MWMLLSRGWLSRLELVSSDKEEFCRLDRLLISVAVEGGNQPGPEQVCISIAMCITLSPLGLQALHAHASCPFKQRYIP